MWDRAAACFHADKKPPDSCGRGSSGCGRTVLNFEPVRALPAWNASRMDGASALRMESEPQKRWYSRWAGRPTPRPARMERGRPFLPCLEIERSSGRVDGDLRRRWRSGGRDRAGKELFSPVAMSQADRRSDFFGWRRALE